MEHGEYDGNLYGTKMDSIHEVVDAGRTCILDVNPQVWWNCARGGIPYYLLVFTVLFPPQALKVLKTAEFMPFVVFIAAPELDTLRAMHKAVVDAGLTTKLLTVCFQQGPINLPLLRSLGSQYAKCLFSP